jgi:hypothetical protein
MFVCVYVYMCIQEFVYVCMFIWTNISVTQTEMQSAVQIISNISIITEV